MQTAACQNSTPAPLARRTPYTIPKACSRVLSSQPGLRQLRRLAPVCLPESPPSLFCFPAFPRSGSNLSTIYPVFPLRAFRRSRQCHGSRRDPWTLNAGFASPSIQATGNSPALPARRPLKGAPKKKPQKLSLH